jgi:hypothetical protein
MGGDVGFFGGVNWPSFNNFQSKASGGASSAGMGANLFSNTAGGADVAEFSQAALVQPKAAKFASGEFRKTTLAEVNKVSKTDINSLKGQCGLSCPGLWESLANMPSEEHMLATM